MLDKIVQGIGALTGGNFVSNLIANAITSKILGGSTKDALIFTALQQGLGQGLNLFGGQEAGHNRLISLILLYKREKQGLLIRQTKSKAASCKKLTSFYTGETLLVAKAL